ncbi:hypothetical protein AX17_002026 [Amanita inopinata Kibby_2008]|nr:hypothetical protein AX17_002026 [Amanita inopinata Kibby_2008]
MLATVSATPAASSIVLPTSGGADGCGVDNRVVRFDNKCILIPEQHRKRSRVVTKSVSLPLWKRRSSQLSDTESTEDPSSPVTPTAPEETHVIIKVPIPSFIVRSSRSPSRRVSSPSASPQPLSPCLVHRSPLAAPTSHPGASPALRRPSLPIYHRSKDSSIVTVPLRACCPDCVPITEECLREGEHWQVKFTRGARRRRSASLDNTSPLPAARTDPIALAIEGCPTGNSNNPPLSRPIFTLTVDEVDRRRRSLDLSEEDFRRSKPPPSSTLSDVYPFPSPNPSHGPRCLQREYMNGPSAELTPNHCLRQAARASPIQEEDEDQLFPLPSPRRTPSASPSSSLNLDPSPKMSPAASPLSSGRSTPIPSPAGSSSCLSSFIAKPGTPSGSDESILTHSLSRKIPIVEEPVVEPISGIPPIVLNEQVTLMCSPALLVESPPSSPVTSTHDLPFLPSPNASPSVPKSSPPAMPKKTRKPSLKTSFPLPFLKAGADALRSAGVDVLKGVSTMNGTGGGVS